MDLFAASNITPPSFTKKKRQCEPHSEIAQVNKFHSISLVEKKKIHSSAWGPPLCMTKPKNEIKNSTPSENRGCPERINAHPEK